LGLNLQQKQAVVAEVSEQVKQAQAIVVAEYRGLAVAAMTDLRKKARGSGVYLRVLKNTLVRRAVADTPFAGLTEKMVGPLAYGIASDPVTVAKVLHEFSRGNDKFVIKAGALPNAVMSAKDVATLATMPSREQLLAMLMGTMQAPVSTLMRTINEVPGKLVRTLAALREQREKQAA
jgi:large subunit ribosomal protein L10